MGELRLGVIGAGFWAPYQISGWHEIEGVRCVAISSRSRSSADAIAQRFGMHAFDDLDTMVEREQLDVLDIITPVETHAEYVRRAAEWRIPVVCQKPMAPSLAEAQSMVAVCRDAGVPFLVNENWRYQAPMQRLKRWLDSGVVGAVHRARIVFSTSFPVFDNQPFLATVQKFILADIGSHILDCARFLFGEASSLMCHASRVNSAIQGEDVATVIMRMERCPTVVCDMSYASRLRDESFPQTYVVIEGELGSLELRRDYRILLTTPDQESDETEIPPHFAWADPAYDLVHSSIVACQRALVQDLAGHAPSGLRGHENLRTVELVDASYRSSETGDLVRLC